MKNCFITLLSTLLAVSGFSQKMGYEVFGTLIQPKASFYPPITLDTLKEAKTLKDINTKYRPDWVASYNSVAISSNCSGVVKKAIGKNNTLTREQINVLKSTSTDCQINVEIDYIPKNNLKNNPPRKMKFSPRIIPIYEAKFPDDYQNLKAYLKKNIVDKILESTIGTIELAKIRFHINEEGKVSDAHIFETSQDDKIDKLLLEAIRSMPRWEPAKNVEGINIAQEFEFSVGTDLLRCDYYVY